jgi:hypothetical protein
MKKVYDDKTLNISQGDFEKPPGRLTVELDCSKYSKQSNSSPVNDFGF